MIQVLSKRTKRLSGLQRQTRTLEATATKLARLSATLANVRLAAVVFGLFITVASILFVEPWWSAGIALVVSAIGFIGLVVAHRRVNRDLQHYSSWQSIKREQIARMQLNWALIPTQKAVAPEGHPFAADIDLPLVHRLICEATTPQASQRLYDWLLATEPDLETVYQRQRAVKELTPRRLFRMRLALYGCLHEEALSELNYGNDVTEWLKSKQEPPHYRLLTIVTLILAMVQLILLGASRLGMVSSEVWLISFAVYAGLFLLQRRRAGNLFREATALHEMLETLGHIMRYLETRRFPLESELNRLCAPFIKTSPSRHLRRLTWLASGASLHGNFLLWFAIHSILPLDLIVALGLYHEKSVLLRLLPEWLDKWYELDALSSLATYTDLNPDYNFPSLRWGEPTLEAKGLGHPLISRETRVSNDLSMSKVGTIYLFTGSNMSGKSTFLRSIGVNISIAQAGGPVDAIEFHASPLRLFTSMRITDSIPEGLSYFYAEVKRLRALLDAVQKQAQSPVCLLIDEIFRGTNNRERLIGSQAYLRALIGQRMIGLIATHDLELAQLTDENPLLQNYHFEERIVDDRLIFDYQLKRGPSTSTNALVIMKAEGLPVDTPSSSAR